MYPLFSYVVKQLNILVAIKENVILWMIQIIGFLNIILPNKNYFFLKVYLSEFFLVIVGYKKEGKMERRKSKNKMWVRVD